MAKRWSKAEIAHLKRNAKSQNLEELAQRLHTDVATVRHKLKDLGLAGSSAGSGSTDAAVKRYGEALALMQKQKWQQASALLEEVIADSDGIHLADRARQHLEICRQQTEKVKDEADPYLRAVFEKNRGNLEHALKLCRKQNPEKEERFAYLLASIHALDGQEDEALKLLETAIRLEPKNRVHAFHDPDFRKLHGKDEFSSLVEAP